MQSIYEHICDADNEQHVMDELFDRVCSGGKPCVPLQSKLLILLWYVASQDKYSFVADRFGTSEFTVCNIV